MENVCIFFQLKFRDEEENNLPQKRRYFLRSPLPIISVAF